MTGCYVLLEDVFEACKLVQPSVEGEYQLSGTIVLFVHVGYVFDKV